MNKFFRFSIAAIAAVNSLGVTKAEEIPDFYNAGEERGSFDLVMKPYPIPIATTTYTDFFFNLPDNLPDLYHIVMGEVIISQPLHLHHFVLTGCSEKIDPAIEGLPSETGNNCIIPLGGWAPGGNVFGNVANDTGVLMGKGLGIQAVQLNVHYTDGVYEDAATMTQKIATDGIKVHYTRDFRPFTSTQKALINIGFATKELNIPPGEDRFFVTKTCKVNTSCKDSTPEILQNVVDFFGMGNDGSIPDNLSCPNIKLFCNMGGDLGSFIQRLCPASCGYCDAVEGEVNPMDPGSYRMTGINYHAHLLGREMYTTLLREKEIDASLAVQKAALSAPSTTEVKDLKSAEFWIYDFQETISLDYEDVVEVDGTNDILRGTDIVPGDKIQVTCVYDSSNREGATQFSLSTYDEMCITTAIITFDTPASLLAFGNNSTAFESKLNILTEINLMSFSCDEDEETDIYTGTLVQGEDGRDIWKNHPLAEAEGCTFPTAEYAPTVYRSRNCIEDDEYKSESPICEGLGSSVRLVDDAIAGASCVGGTYAERDSNDGITEKECVDGGGAWTPYTCEDIENWLMFEATFSGIDAETVEFLRVYWWQDKCCMEDSDSSSVNAFDDSSSASAMNMSSLVALVSAAFLAMIW